MDRLNAREGDLVGEPLAPAIVHYVREGCRGGDDVPHEDLVEHLAEPHDKSDRRNACAHA